MRLLCVGNTPDFIEDVISKWSSYENVSIKILVPGNKNLSNKLITKFPNLSFNYFPNREIKNDIDIKKFEIKGFTINRIIRSDRVLRKRNYDESLSYCKNVINLIVEEINNFKPTLIFSTYDNAHAGLSYLVAQFIGIKWAAFYFTAIPKGFCTISPNPFEMDKIFNTNADDWKYNDSLNLINNTENKSQDVFMYITSYKFLSFFKNLLSRLTRSTGYNKYQWTTILERLTIIFKKIINKISLKIFLFFQREIKDETNQQYALYLLQMSPESTVDVWATEYISQIQVIEDLSINLPSNFKLYVKIHPSDPGSLSIMNLFKIKSLGNIHIISYKFKSRTYIEKARLVATITGTAALEAFIYSVPSIMFGKHFYSRLPGINYFDLNRTELGLFISNIIQNKTVLSVDEKVSAFTKLMRNFSKARLNNWAYKKTSISESKSLFKILKNYAKYK